MTDGSAQQVEVLQANVNHCARAQDLLVQHVAEWSIGAAVVVEPYCVPPLPTWVGDADGLVAITSPRTGDRPPLSRIDSGPGYAAARWGEFVIVAAYFSPNRPLRAFEDFLERVGEVIGRAAPAPVLLMGDLNAKHSAWGSPVDDPRGEALYDWAVGAGLEVLNRGNVDTCVRRNGASIQIQIQIQIQKLYCKT
ncbi:uncharacterized protein LOC135309992 [Plodia interpunctella]|uniref:uncharacterized protein LOC135309992 n=1 Tax=Plodia interpunctella TaxID=58824 RepID=UPI003100CD58